MRKLLIFLLMPLCALGVFAQGEYIPVGEVVKVDASSGFVEIRIYHTGVADRINESSELILLDEDNKKVVSFTPKTIFHAESPVRLTAGLIKAGYPVYAGQKVGVSVEIKEEIFLPDQRYRPDAPEKYYLNPADQSSMVLIPEGAFVYGSDIPGTVHYTTPAEDTRTAVQVARGQKRVRYLQLKSYYIDVYEVTKEQFNRYLIETGFAPPPGWNLSEPSLPVHNLSYVQAEGYCRWAHKRLPTELEWEKAARGPGLEILYRPDQTKEYIERIMIYPTGLSFDPDVCVTDDTTASVQSVYTLKDRNIYGLFGLCGNAAEWTSSWFMPYRGNTWKHPDFGKRFKVIRGGAFDLPSSWTKTYERLPGGIPSLASDFRAGVRCVKDVKDI